MSLAAAGCGSSGKAASPQPTVYAATSLTAALPALAPHARASFGASNALQLQIERGAPADVFLSAGPKQAQALFREGRCERPVTFATNKLVLIVRHGDPKHVRSVYGLRPGHVRLSVGDAQVPIGDYTRKILNKLRLASILRTNTVSEQANVGQVVSQVALGGADAGFVYVTDARTQAARVDAIELPAWAQPPVAYQACAVRRKGANTAAAHALIASLRTAGGRATLRRFGFGLPS
jgi:molybdate transport system substrate-binding protein